MKSTRLALLVALALGLASAVAVAGDSECWKGQYTKTGKKAIRAECCEQMEGSYLCNRVGDDDALVEFGPGDCRPSKNRRQLKCEKACGSGCSHKFDGTR